MNEQELEHLKSIATSLERISAAFDVALCVALVKEPSKVLEKVADKLKSLRKSGMI